MKKRDKDILNSIIIGLAVEVPVLILSDVYMNQKLFADIATIYSDLDERFSKLKEEISDLDTEVSEYINETNVEFVKIYNELGLDGDEIINSGYYGYEIDLKENAHIYTVYDLENPITIPSQNINLKRVIGGAIFINNQGNYAMAMNEDEMVKLLLDGYNVYGYLALNENSENIHDYEGVFLKEDINILNTSEQLVRKHEL